ncbi:MAG: alanine racemase [Chloroflexi bacterium]|nr:alanine racemase [Chloroflexota bacterium]
MPRANQLAVEVATPALMVDLDVFDANVAALSAMVQGTGKTVRPHVKTHRTPRLAARQLGPHAAGVTCATVGEAEKMVASGISDILIANEVVDPAKVARVAALARGASVRVAVDAPGPVKVLAETARRAGVVIGVLIEVDILLHRGGVVSATEAIELAQAMERSHHLRFDGLMAYEGRQRASVPDRGTRIARAYATLAGVRSALIDAGFGVACVSAAGTSTLREALADPTITEIQAGAYALMEPDLAGLGLPFRCAAVVRGTVISRHGRHFVLDAGRRSIGMEYGPPTPLRIEHVGISVSDEHTTIETDVSLPELGERVDLVPGQIRTTFNLHDAVWVARGDQIVDRWPISARGQSS